jgi:hypothetical protein
MTPNSAWQPSPPWISDSDFDAWETEQGVNWKQYLKNWVGDNPDATDREISAYLNTKGISIEQAAEALNFPVAEAQRRFAIATQGKQAVKGEALKDISEDILFEDEEGEEAFVPGTFLKNYKSVDVESLLPKQTVEAISREGTITAEDAIEQLDTLDGVDVPDDVTSNAITAATEKFKKAVNDGSVTPESYEAKLAVELANTVPAFSGWDHEAIITEIRALSQPAKKQQISEEEAASRRAKGVDYIINPDSLMSKRITGDEVTVSETPEAEAATRAAITGGPATGEEAEIIKQVGYEARQRTNITGQAAVGAAANVLTVTGELPPEVAAAIVDSPETVSAEIDTQTIEVQAAIAALPTEALVSSQIEALLGGMESGNIPTWAKPAVSAVEQKLAARGLGVSTVGRDALFNAIIQTALPIAQNNAQALQARAAQNLSNEQQANLETARLDATRRLSNLSNQQTASSQTAQFAQSLTVLRGQ